MTSDEQHVEQVRAQFTRQADAYARMTQTTDERGLRRLVEVAGVTAEERVLDVACGPGFFTAALAAVAREVVGLDATEALLDIARAGAAERQLANMSFRQGEAERMPLENDAFDLTTCRAAFHHFPEPARVLAEMKRVVRPGGRILIADILASDDTAEAALHNRIERLCDPTHTRALGEGEFASMFDEAGLTVALRKEGAIGYDLEEWMEHGGPDEDAAVEIRRLMTESMRGDAAGLAVEMKGGRIRFRHRTVVYMLACDR